MHRPELRTPPPLTPQGEPVQPVPEQSFIQKYWIYILIALGALGESRSYDLYVRFTHTLSAVLTGGGESEEVPKEGGR
jgi:hypothetical protein